MNSRIRIITIVFAFIILVALFLVPYFNLINSLKTGNQLSIFSIIISLLFIAGIASIFWLTLIVEFDVKSQEIRFIYPLRFKTYRYKFTSIYGFRYRYLPARIDYKAIQFQTENGKKFTISDFETENLRVIEQLCNEYLELRRGKTFEQLTEQQKSSEIETSRKFDFQQAKDIRFFLILAIAVSVFVIGLLLSKPEKLNLYISIFLAFLTLLTISMTNKLRKIQRKIKTEHNTP